MKCLTLISMLAIVSVIAGCGGGGGGGAVVPPVTCTSHSSKACYSSDVFWYDSCGTREELFQNCSASQTCASGQCVTQMWSKTFGDTLSDYAEEVEETADGGYIVAGDLKSASSLSDFRVIKLDSTGTQTWAATFGGALFDVAKSIKQTSDGGYIAAGYTSSQGAGGTDAWVINLNSSGAQSWAKTFGGTQTDVAESIQETADGGFVVAGYTDSQGAGNEDFWVLKLTVSGSQTWEKVLGGAGLDVARDIHQTSDNGYVVAGYTESTGAGLSDFRVIKLDSSGNVVWDNTYGGVQHDIANSVRQTSDGGYIVCGETASYGSGNADAWVIKLNASGVKTWDKTYGGTSADVANSVRQTTDGGYIVAGYTESSGSGGTDFMLIKIDSSGTETWSRNFGGTTNDVANSVRQTSDGGYIVAGYTSSSGAGQQDFWIIKLDSNGQN